ncbi:MAG TPA: ribosomal protein L7/L12 [Pseudoxanthomonas sp.]|nr:ribosomal protein L7/L12 [Pseudoxanthomonas sp.]
MSREIRFPAAAVSALAKGNRIEAIKLVREANHGVDLRGAMEAVDAHASGRQSFPVDHAPPMTATIGNTLPLEAMAALSRGQLIEAIKIVREKTGLGLKESKDMVERQRDGSAPERDDAMRAQLQGIAHKQGIKLPESALEAMERGDLKGAMHLLRQAKDAGLKSMPAGAYAENTARGAHTVSRETNRNGWLWALAVLALLATSYVWLAGS